MTIEDHHFPPSSFEYENIRKESTVNGTFAVACTGCPIHSLRFRVPGYVSEEYTISPSEPEENSMMARFVAVMSGKEDPGSGEPFVFRRSGIRIVLHPQSSFVRVILRDVQLATGEEGPFMVLAGKPPKLNFLPSNQIGEGKDQGLVTRMPLSPLFFSLLKTPCSANWPMREKRTAFTPWMFHCNLELQGVDGGFIPAETTAL
jgi:hypothetical protein